MPLRPTDPLIASALLFVTGCVVSPESLPGSASGPSTDSSPESAGDAPLARRVLRADDGSLRVPYLGGAFVTRSAEMPIEVEQAIAGVPTNRPVIVWAGLDRDVAREAPASATSPQRP